MGYHVGPENEEFLIAWQFWIYKFSVLIGLHDDGISDEIAQAFNITPPFRLDDFTYSNNLLLEIIFRHLEDTSFNGITVNK